MTKIMMDCENIKDISTFSVDVFVLNLKSFSIYPGRQFSIEEIEEIVNRSDNNDYAFFIAMDKIIEENELPILTTIMRKIADMNIEGILYSDFAIPNIASMLSLNVVLIYDAKTMTANKEDAKIFKNLGHQVMISNELNQYQIHQIASTENASMMVYGFHPMFYSKRKLISMYRDFADNNKLEKDHVYFIKEETRNNRYPIIENNQGTFIYTDYIYVACKKISSFIHMLKYIRISPFLIKKDSLVNVVRLFRKVLTNQFDSIDDIDRELHELNSLSSSGFLELKSFLLREDE